MVGPKMIIIFPLAMTLVSSQAAAQSCVPPCVKDGTPPVKGGPACTCTPAVSLPGCIIAPCKLGEKSHGEYTCLCSKDAKIDECTTTRCPNGTLFEPNCNTMCGCSVQQVPDCTEKSGHPVDGNPACGCTPNIWPNGCTIRPCTSNTREEPTYFCECTKEFSPDHCYKSRCKN